MLSTRTNSVDFVESRGAIPWLQSPYGEVWIKFLLALVGLGMAFAAALLSTAAGEAGNPLSSVLLASLALLLAAFVGLVTVPYLARRVAVERLRQSLRYEVTKAGIVYVLATLVIGVAALNTGNNLLYIVVAAMLAAIVVSGVVSALVLRSLQLEVGLPEHVFAGTSVMARVSLCNPRYWLPAFSIRIVAGDKEKKNTARKQWRWERTTFALPLNRPPERQWLRMRDWKVRRVAPVPIEPGIFDGAVYFPYLPAKSDSQADLQLRFARRGRYSESSFGLATSFPFSFLTKTRDVALNREILVYPPIEPTDEFLDLLPRIAGECESFVRGRGSDLYRIREYMPEDSARHVDWKATAKSGSLKVREFAREDDRRVRIIFDNPVAGLVSADKYERAVNLAASLAWHFASQQSDLSFSIPALGISGGARISDVHDFLGSLAVIEPAQQFENLSPENDFSSGEFNIVITARTRESFPAASWNSTYFILANQ